MVRNFDPWIRIRYRILLEEFGNREFTSKDVEEILKKHRKELANVREFLGKLCKDGFLGCREEGKRKVYWIKQLKLEEKVVARDEIIKTMKMGADLIRGRVDYKNLLVLLFYKALSDKWLYEVSKFYSEVKDKREVYHLANVSFYSLYDESTGKLYTWNEVTKDKVHIVRNFIEALNKIAEPNEKISDLKLLVNRLGFESFISNEDNRHIFLDLIDIFSKLDFRNADYDVVGSAYEWILSYFAPAQAKQGENYTPREVIRLMVELLDIEENSDILDPALGSGAMLIEAYRYANERYNDGRTLFLVGQEVNDTVAILAKINLLLHGIENYDIQIGDSLINPKFPSADYVLTNPPWNLDGYDERRVNREDLKSIYRYGFTPKQSADWLWIQLILSFSKKKAAIVLDNGALFRGGKEKRVRKKIVENDLIECIILLPEKLFYNTGAPGMIMILNKNKPDERRGKILFINASQEYEQHPEVRKLNRLGKEHIRKISQAYHDFQEIEGFSRIVPLDEIKENDYNLNVTLYVFPEEEVEEIDVAKEWEELKKLEDEIKKVERRTEEYLKEMG